MTVHYLQRYYWVSDEDSDHLPITTKNEVGTAFGTASSLCGMDLTDSWVLPYEEGGKATCEACVLLAWVNPESVEITFQHYYTGLMAQVGIYK